MKNWKTTLFGAIAAVLYAIQPMINALNGNFTKADLITLSKAAAIALIGYFAKDFNVTGPPGSNVSNPIVPVLFIALLLGLGGCGVGNAIKSDCKVLYQGKDTSQLFNICLQCNTKLPGDVADSVKVVVKQKKLKKAPVI